MAERDFQGYENLNSILSQIIIISFKTYITLCYFLNAMNKKNFQMSDLGIT